MKSKDYLYFFMFVTLVFSLISLYTAFVSFPISNLTLVSYSFSVAFIWKTSSILAWKVGEQAQNAKKAFIYFLFASIYLFISIISYCSCIWLFPHPYIHQFLIAAIYITGIIISLNIYYLSYSIRTGKMSKILLLKSNIRNNYIHICEIRKNHVAKQLEYFNKQKIESKDKNKDKEYLLYNAKKYTLRRLLNASLYVLIFSWIFVIIPLMSLEKIRMLYMISIVTTSILCFFYLIATFIKAYKTCEIFAEGIAFHTLFSNKKFFWEEITSITMKETEVIFQLENESYSLPFYNIENKDDFLFFKTLLIQGDLLFSKVTNEKKWNEQAFIKKIFKEKNRKLSQDFSIEIIDANSIYLLDKNNSFYIKKVQNNVKVFNGKLPYNIYFLIESFWKQINKKMKKSQEKIISLFQEEYKDRVSLNADSQQL